MSRSQHLVKSTDLGAFRSRILASMGLAPVLALAACDAPAPASADEIVASETDDLARISGATPRLTLEIDTTEANRLATFVVTGAQPGAEVRVGYGTAIHQVCPPTLNGVCFDAVDAPHPLEVTVADALGTAILQEPVPALADGAAIVFEAKATDAAGIVDVSEPYDTSVDHPVRSCVEPQEIDPDDNVRDGHFKLVCGEKVGDTCTPALQLGSWTAEQMYVDGLGRNISGRWAVSARCLETSITDECCYVMRTDDTWGGYQGYVGRPFEVAGRPRVADRGAASGWSDAPCFDVDGLAEPLRQRLETYWSKLGIDEHASVASFSRFNLELVALGAPSALLAASTRAVADEIKHARISFGIASVFAGAPVSPGRIAIEGALARSADAEAVLVAAILEGCINETICAAQASAAARGAVDPALRGLLREVAEDESRHSELSWAFVRWMLATHPELRPAAARAFDAFALGAAPAADPDREALAAFGMTTEDTNHAIAEQVLRLVVRPCADLLLGRVAGVEVSA